MENTGLSAQTQFFHLFKVMFDSGDVALMGAQAFTIYAYIKSCVNYEKAEAFPTIETIVEKTGISRAQVFKELPKLVDMGYLSSRKQGRKTIYTLCEKIPLIDKDGNVQTTATWEYVPQYAAKAVQELKDILRGNAAPGEARFVHIENLQVIISQVQEGATQNVYNGAHVDNRATQLNSPSEPQDVVSEAAMGSHIKIKDYIAHLKESGQEIPEELQHILKLMKMDTN